MLSKKKDSGGRARRPSEKVKQAMHEQQETAQRRNAKAQRDRERCRLRLLMEEGSENEDDEDDNRDEGQHTHVEEDDDEDEDIHVGYLTFFAHLLTDHYNQFSSEIVRSKLSAVSSQWSDSSSQ